MSDVLVDSSAWIDFLRGRPEAVRRVDLLLAEDRAATTAIVTAEVISGTRSRAAFDEIRGHFAALPSLPAPEDLWPRVAELRFTLARRGTHAHLIDLAIASIAVHASHRLLSRDRDFTSIAQLTGLDLELF